MTIKSTHDKPVPPFLARVAANLIDAIVITIIDVAVMYLFWLIGMVTGFLDTSPEHWGSIVASAPLFFLDRLFVIVLPITAIYLNLTQALHEQTLHLANALFAVLIMVNWLYRAFFESSNDRATPGKRFMDLQVVTQQGKAIDFLGASCRHFAKMVSVLLVGIAALPLFGSHKDQSLHDLIAKCVIFHNEH